MLEAAGSAGASRVQLVFKTSFIGRKFSGPTGRRYGLVTLSGNRAGLVWLNGEYFQGNVSFLQCPKAEASLNFQSNCLAFSG